MNRRAQEILALLKMNFPEYSGKNNYRIRRSLYIGNSKGVEVHMRGSGKLEKVHLDDTLKSLPTKELESLIHFAISDARQKVKFQIFHDLKATFPQFPTDYLLPFFEEDANVDLEQFLENVKKYLDENQITFEPDEEEEERKQYIKHDRELEEQAEKEEKERNEPKE